MQLIRFREQLTESVSSVLPIALIVCLMCFSISPVSPDIMPAIASEQGPGTPSGATVFSLQVSSVPELKTSDETV